MEFSLTITYFKSSFCTHDLIMPGKWDGMIRADKKTRDTKESNVSVGEICIKMYLYSMRAFYMKT